MGGPMRQNILLAGKARISARFEDIATKMQKRCCSNRGVYLEGCSPDGAPLRRFGRSPTETGNGSLGLEFGERWLSAYYVRWFFDIVDFR